MREISESEWNNRVAKTGTLDEFKELVLKESKQNYSFGTIERATKQAFDWLFHSNSVGYQTIHAQNINEKYEWLVQKKIIDKDKFFTLMLTTSFFYTKEKMDVFYDIFNKNQLPLKEKCKLLAKGESLYFIAHVAKVLCPNLQDDSRFSLFFSKAVASVLTNLGVTESEPRVFESIKELKKINFDFMQSFKGMSLMEYIVRKTNHPYLILQIYPELPQNYRLAILPSIVKGLKEIENETIQYNFFLHDMTKEKFLKEAFIMLEVDLITPTKIPKGKILNKL